MTEDTVLGPRLLAMTPIIKFVMKEMLNGLEVLRL